MTEALSEGRIPLKDVQHEAVDKLIAKHDGASATLTHRDPGESGPLLVSFDDDNVYEVDDEGSTKKQRKKAS